MHTDRLAVVVTALLLIVLVGHVCPLGASTLDRLAATPASPAQGSHSHHEHHDSHLSACLPGAILPDSGAPILGPGVIAESPTAMVATVAIPPAAVLGEPPPDPAWLRPPIYLLNTVLLI